MSAATWATDWAASAIFSVAAVACSPIVSAIGWFARGRLAVDRLAVDRLAVGKLACAGTIHGLASRRTAKAAIQKRKSARGLACREVSRVFL